jgi:hypothetical protein
MKLSAYATVFITHSLSRNSGSAADDRDYQLFIGDVYRNLKSKLLERFEEGTIIQDIATGYCAWEPKVGPSLDSQGPSHNHLDELARAASYMSPLQQNLVQGNVTGESCNPDNLESDDDFQDCLDGGGGGSHSNVGAKNCAAEDGNALSKQQDEVEAVWMESDLLLECPTRKWMKGQKLPYFNLQHNRRPKTVHKINWDIEASDNANPVKKKRKSCNQKRRYKPPGFISCDCAAGNYVNDQVAPWELDSLIMQHVVRGQHARNGYMQSAYNTGTNNHFAPIAFSHLQRRQSMTKSGMQACH